MMPTFSKRSETCGACRAPRQSSPSLPCLTTTSSPTFHASSVNTEAFSKARSGSTTNPSASPDEWVVNGYPLLYEKIYLRVSLERRRAQVSRGGIAFAGCLHPSPLTDLARQRRWPQRLSDRPQ